MTAPWRPCSVGDMMKDIDTPALVVDLDSLESNINKMSKIVEENYPNVKIRPHCKTHKCPNIAHMQMNSGAVGFCCQTITETDALVNAGINDIFISNQIIGLRKIRRVVGLAKIANISLCVDDADNVRDIDTVAGDLGIKMDVVVEVHVGAYRCGVNPGEPVAELAQLITELPNVNFKGLHCYQGRNQHQRKEGDRKKEVENVVALVKQSLEALSKRGIPCEYITGGGTGSFKYEASSTTFTEIQPGSYVFMDVDYGKNLNTDGSFYNEFKNSLYVLSTVQSKGTNPNRVVVDAGMKALSVDSGVPLLKDFPSITYNIGGDEHGVLTKMVDGEQMPKEIDELKVGDIIRLIPGHCDPTVNMHDWIIGLRGDKVECIWPVAGRGPGV
ncbi:unnamed protein product [Owenia fusiformis]|uniref:Uncharacterized protein n=1 Tax=Owenia fusiformis TaxID=6347 RepID=A0A8J1TW88_OWEFU|nr:unnamed protein product [Owenia fusiformis]